MRCAVQRAHQSHEKLLSEPGPGHSSSQGLICAQAVWYHGDLPAFNSWEVTSRQLSTHRGCPRLLDDKTQNKGIIHRHRHWNWAAKKAVSNNNQGVRKKKKKSCLTTCLLRRILCSIYQPRQEFALQNWFQYRSFECMATEGGNTDTVLHGENFYLFLSCNFNWH